MNPPIKVETTPPVKRIIGVGLLITLLVCGRGIAEDAPVQTGLVNLVFSVDGEDRTAALYIPKEYKGTKKWPLLVFLHGGGGGGDNNGDARPWGKNAPIIRTLQQHPEWYPGLVLMPRCPKGKIWAPGPKDPVQSPWRLRKHGTEPIADAAVHITAAMDAVAKAYAVDSKRISLMGHSMGGEGSTLYAGLHADRIAAVAPSAGSAIIVPEHAPELAKMGVWMFQGEHDTISTTKLAREMVAAIKAAGGAVRYSELEGVGHGSLRPMLENEEVFTWLLSQKLE